mmetsp:Transcript_22848/g.58202  ORF Transcript_22848/g.58202 Transcript_22848/m.58202 type:complete len:461 (-) Transcript_22848:496-1878(-)
MSKKTGASVPLLSVSPPLQHANRATGQGAAAASQGSMSGGQRGLPGRTSPLPGDRRNSIAVAALRTARQQATIAPGQPVPASRQRDKFVPLPDDPEDEGIISADGGVPAEGPSLSVTSRPDSMRGKYLYPATTIVPSAASEPAMGTFLSPGLFEDLPVQVGMPPPPPPLMFDTTARRGRVTFYCVAESFDRKKLEELLKLTYPPGTVLSYPDVFYVEYIKGMGDQPGGDIFFFDYGVVACWGLTKSQEMTIVRGLARQCHVQPLPDREVETDEFQYNFTTTEKPHVQNDAVTLHKRYANDHKMKLAVSYALAQSTKLSVYEQRVVDIVLETKNLPEALAERGEVDIAATDIAKLIGKVFIQKSAVNLLSSVLDTPEFFWHAPDSFQTLYQRVVEYLELPVRVELLNSRFSVLQEMLDMLRDHQNNYHNVRLEWIVIWLIVVEVIVGLFELLGLFGMVGQH